ETGFEVSLPSARKVADFITGYEPRIEEMEKKFTEAQETTQSKLSTQDERLQTMEEILKRLLEEQEAFNSKVGKNLPDRDPASSQEEARQGFPVWTPGTEEGKDAQNRIRRIMLEDTSSPKKPSKKSVRLPAGSFADAVLLTGVFAPVEGQALPVKLRLASPFVTPNRGRVPLDHAFLIGKALGDANSQRVVIQLETLSYVKPSGETIEVAVNGYIVDADGVQGAGGRYIYRVNDVMVQAGLAGGLSAAADAAATRETLRTTSPLGGVVEAVTGDSFRHAAWRGAGRASGELQKIVIRRLDQIIPSVWVPNGKRVTVSLIEGVTLPGLSPQEIEDGRSRFPFEDLDIDR
ncbi:MAG: TraB/VirB10 family protein, partial [Planctomycetota bacterium]